MKSDFYRVSQLEEGFPEAIYFDFNKNQKLQAEEAADKLKEDYPNSKVYFAFIQHEVEIE